ncbi:MAG TPA: ABC transporter permease [Streptosporangiaceae bacterium]|nr:ABC transporter permease [Streptosporangiaceae bacterium]
MKLARDMWLTFQYEVRQLLSSPAVIAFTLLTPVTYLLLFTPFLKSVLGAPSYDAAFQIYVPSLFCSMGLFGGLFSGLTLLASMREGVVTRFRVTPMSRIGLVLGRELKPVVLCGIQAGVIAVLALALGLRLPPANFVLAMILLAITNLLGVSISYSLAITVPNETALANLINGMTQPLGLLAGVLVPLSVAPLWIKDIALWNPFAWATNAMRALFQGHLADQVVWEAAVILAGVCVLATALSARLFTRETV